MAAKVVTFGEIMLRLSPPGFERFLQSPGFVATFGGGEANVAVSLARFGLESWYVTRLPAHAIGESAVKQLRAEGVRTEAIARGGDRMGIYFTEAGASQRASVVIYDRARSAISEMEPGTIDWPAIFAGAAWFHVTGITPALGERAVACTREAIAAARAAGTKISIDLNFRKKLWSEKDAQKVMRDIVRNIDLLIANEEDLQSTLGIQVADTHVTAGQLDVDAYRAAAEHVTQEFGIGMSPLPSARASQPATTAGRPSLEAATKTFHRSQHYEVRLVDRLGGGDSFAAGVIFGLADGRSAGAALRFAVAASALKQTIPGDFNRVSVDEVDRLAGGDGSGRIQR